MCERHSEVDESRVSGTEARRYQEMIEWSKHSKTSAGMGRRNMFSLLSIDRMLSQTSGVVNQSGQKKRSRQKKSRKQDNSDDVRKKRLERKKSVL